MNVQQADNNPNKQWQVTYDLYILSDFLEIRKKENMMRVKRAILARM